MKKIDKSFFRDENGRIKYNEYCKLCINLCKQSFRVYVHYCGRFKEDGKGSSMSEK